MNALLGVHVDSAILLIYLSQLSQINLIAQLLFELYLLCRWIKGQDIKCLEYLGFLFSKVVEVISNDPAFYLIISISTYDKIT